MKWTHLFTACFMICQAHPVLADVVVPIHLTSDNQEIGSVSIKESANGLVFKPKLHDLPPGDHGFHVHTHPSCDNHGQCAGGHLDPANTGKHLGPYKNGHLGDLPVLQVSADGTAMQSVIAPRLKLKDVLGHSLMIHAGGDNYSDEPVKLGGGGDRIACGSIPAK